MKNKLVILVGNIGSGKTTLAKEYCKNGYICVSRDSLRYMIGAGDYTWDTSFEKYIFSAETALLHTFLKSCRNIIVDEVGMTKSLRRIYINLADFYKYECIAVVLPRYSKKKCIDRRIKNPHSKDIPREQWEDAWETFDSSYEEPTKSEGFSKIIKIK